MRDSKRLLFIAGVAALAIGCKGKDKKSSDGADTDSSPKVTEGSGGARPAESATISLPSNEPRFLNPLLESRFNRANMLIFEGLVGLDSKLAPVPRLAKEWTVSEDGKTINFSLRDDVTWSDGEPFTSKDVAFTFKALRNLKDVSNLWLGFMADVEAVETPDPHTVIVRYTKPYTPALMTWTMGILPEHVLAGDVEHLESAEANQKPIGTGPYRLSRWDVGKQMVLTANPKWWNGRPKIGTVRLAFDVKDQLASLRAGDLDFAEIKDPGDWVTQAQQPEFRDRFELTSNASPLLRMLAWNTQRGRFKDPRVRVALTQALNRRRVVEDLLLGQGQLVSAPMFPTMFGIDHSVAPYPFDLDAAKKLLDEAGVKANPQSGHRFDFTIVTYASQKTPVNEEMMARYERDLEKGLGIGLRVEYLPYDEWRKRVVVKRDFDAAYLGWLPEIPDPDPYSLLHSSQITEGKQNFAGYQSKEADALLEEARRVSDRDERRAIYEKLHGVLHRDMPYTVAYAPLRTYAWSRRVRGVSPTDIGSFPRFPGLPTWWIEKR